jgi:hypothetical protein
MEPGTSCAHSELPKIQEPLSNKNGIPNTNKTMLFSCNGVCLFLVLNRNTTVMHNALSGYLRAEARLDSTSPLKQGALLDNEPVAPVPGHQTLNLEFCSTMEVPRDGVPLRTQ